MYYSIGNWYGASECTGWDAIYFTAEWSIGQINQARYK
jgi:hypothetical protein